MRLAAVPEGFEPCPVTDGRFADLVGTLYQRRDEPGRFGFPVEARHANVRETVHGGLLMTRADQVLGITVRRAVGMDVPVVTVSLHCDFVSGAVAGDWIDGEATIARVTKTLVFVRGTLACNGEVVLSAAGVWKMLRRPAARAAD